MKITGLSFSVILNNRIEEGDLINWVFMTPRSEMTYNYNNLGETTYLDFKTRPKELKRIKLIRYGEIV